MNMTDLLQDAAIVVLSITCIINSMSIRKSR